MKKSLIILCCMVSLAACHESMEDRAVREAREYTEKYCPTPPQENTVLDSMVFDKSTRTLYRYYTLVGPADNAKAFEGRRNEFHVALVNNVQNDTGIKAYKEAGFGFAFIYRSAKDKNAVLFEDKIVEKEYR